jgi:hypothetical protein
VKDACAKTSDTRLVARQTLEMVITLYYKTFPQTIIVNKLLQSLTELVKDAQLTDQCPITEELALDIFEGRFSDKFVAAAQVAANLLKDSIYARYYNLQSVYSDLLSEDAVLSFTRGGVPTLQNGRMARVGTGIANWFGDTCKRRAAVSELSNPWGGRNPAENGKIVEQQQIITSHNLASFFSALELKDSLDCFDLAKRTWQWIAKELKSMPAAYFDMLRVCKNIAYAWRQLLFYISFVSDFSRVMDMLRTELVLLQSTASVCDLLTDLILTPLASISQSHGGDVAAVKPLLAWVTEKHPLITADAADVTRPEFSVVDSQSM